MISQPAGSVKAPTTRNAATTSAGRCHWLMSVDTPVATAKLPPRKPASGRQRGETIRNTAAAAEAVSVVWPCRGIETLEFNSLPSGHTTLAASAAAAVFLMVSPRWRPLAGFLGGSFAVATGVSTLINQWHRPADVVAAFFVVGASMLPAGWLIIRTGRSWNVWDGYNGHWASARLWVVLPVLTGLAAAGV